MNDIGWELLNKKDKENIINGIIEGKAFSGPLHIEIHPTDRCTTSCFFCSTRWRRKKDELSLNTISSISKEMKEMGVRSFLLSGGGEPLAHIEKEKILEELGKSKAHMFGVTTNGVGLNKNVREILIGLKCQQVIVSINCSNERTYSEMMQVGPKVFHYVLENVKKLIEERKNNLPKVIFQFLVYKKNYNSIVEMYNLAKEVGVDRIIFNGLSFLKEELKMKKEETEEMISYFKQILKVDEYRKILGIYSFEQDIGEYILKIEREIGNERSKRNILKKILEFILKNKEYSLKEKLKHRKEMKVRKKEKYYLDKILDPCIRPWYCLTIRSDGAVPVCCVRQHILMGNIYENSIKEIWEGEKFIEYRKQMREVILLGKRYKEKKDLISNACILSSKGFSSCPFRSFYYRRDFPFMEKLENIIGKFES